uniref:F-box and leucine rich repeat protein 17 n=1 Tax=Podarcis muralis TaxID=64176 RepID=A0A670IZW5_PODMU
MGHFLSRKGTSQTADRSRRRRPLRGKVPVPPPPPLPPPPRDRSCFLRGPCMLCFLVHSANPPAAAASEEPPPPPAAPPLLYAALKAPEERAARRLLRFSCRRLLLSGLLFSSPPPSARRAGPALESGEAPPEMVCKRKGVRLLPCPPRKQPRCAAAAAIPATGAGSPASTPPPPEVSAAAAAASPSLPEQHLCPLPCASDRARGGSPPKDPAVGENGDDGEGLAAAAGSPSQLPELDGREKGEAREPDCEEPPENPGDCCREPQPPSPDINQLPPSILLKVTDELLERIASRSQNITEINISDCRNVSDTGVCILASKCPGLLRYTAYRCKQLSDTSIIAVASQCPQLQKVHVGNQDRLTDEGLKQLGSECRELKDIHFGQCYKISDEGMIIIAKGCLKLKRIYMQENKLVTDQSVKAFAEHCPELQYVGFMGCSVTSKGVIHLTNLRNLSSLDLRHITELDNETVMEIVKRCKNLTSLNLCLNWIINDRCVEVIAKEGQNLKELYLVSCKITDYESAILGVSWKTPRESWHSCRQSLIAIGRYSMTIETVDVGWCKEITDQGATQIAQSSKSLRYLGLMRCDKVNEVTVEQLVQQHPHITFSTVLQDCKRTLERAYQMGWTPNMSTAS